MKPTLFCFLAFSQMAAAQIDFGSTDTQYQWFGRTQDFTVSSTKEWLSLTSSDSISPTTIYTTDIRTDSVATWRLSAQMVVAPSSSNMIRFYLLADDAENIQNGLSVAIGGTKKCVNLEMTIDGKRTTIIEGTANTLANTTFNRTDIVVSRRLDDDERFHYTLSAVNHDGVEDEGEYYIDDAEWHKKMPQTAITFIFTKTRAQSTFFVGEFSVQMGFCPPAPLPIMQSYGRGCVVVSEIMPVPASDLGLPGSEYLELYNNTDSIVDLADWTISNKSTTGRLPSYLLYPDSCITVCGSSHAEGFADVAAVISPSSWPELTNASCNIVLRSPDRQVIDYVPYVREWFGDGFKKDGGWALERVDCGNLSLRPSNWLPSESPVGGTPGQPNSIEAPNPDTDSPQITSLTCSDTGATVTLTLDEPVDTLALPAEFTINGRAVGVRLAAADELTMANLRFVLDEPLKKSTVYDLNPGTFYDLAGNASEEQSFRLGIAEEAAQGDVVINEIMSTASPADYDFLEIYNKSEKIIDLSNLYVGIVADGELKNRLPLSASRRFMYPGDYIVAADDSLAIVGRYLNANAEYVVQTPSFPALAEESTVAITTVQGDILDQVAYSRNMHIPTLKNADNVSLERISADASSADAGNWTSASPAAGFATPTARNSQNRDGGTRPQSDISIEKRVFTPDGDGLDDELIISTAFTDGLWLATMRVYNAGGLLVATPYNNTALPATGHLRWNGKDDGGGTLAPGTYIITLQAWQTGGKTKEYKESCTIGVTRR